MPLLKNKLFITFFLLANITTVLSQEKITNRTITYEGTIDNKYPIKTYINYLPEWISGKYIYTKYPKDVLSLSGEYIKNGLAFEEEIYNLKKGKTVKTGNFLVPNFNNYSELKGTWKNESTKKEMDFKFSVIEKDADVTYYYKANFQSCTEKEFESLYDERYNDAYDCFNKLSIFNENKKIIQTIDLPNSYAYKELISSSFIELADYNFDGYLDIVITHNYPGVAKGDSGQFYLIYNPNTKKFKYEERYNTELDRDFVLLDPLTQTLSTGTGDGNGNETDTTFIVKDNNFYKIKYFERKEDESYIEIEYKIINGKSVEIKRNTKGSFK